MNEIALGRSSWVQTLYRRPEQLFLITDLWVSNTMLISLYFSSIALRGVDHVPLCVTAEQEYETVVLKV